MGGDRLDLAALSFDGGVMQPKSSVFHPNYFLLKGKVEIGRTFLSILLSLVYYAERFL